MEGKITIEQAYKAMFIFIKRYYYRKSKPEEIGILLGDLQLLSHLYDDSQRDRGEAGLNTADPASWEDWLEAVETILSQGNQE